MRLAFSDAPLVFTTLRIALSTGWGRRVFHSSGCAVGGESRFLKVAPLAPEHPQLRRHDGGLVAAFASGYAHPLHTSAQHTGIKPLQLAPLPG